MQHPWHSLRRQRPGQASGLGHYSCHLYALACLQLHALATAPALGRQAGRQSGCGGLQRGRIAAGYRLREATLLYQEGRTKDASRLLRGVVRKSPGADLRPMSITARRGRAG